MHYGVSTRITRCLQIVENAAARLVVDAVKFDHHITLLLRDVLHWLPVPQRILCKVAATTFACVRDTCALYNFRVCFPVTD